LAKKKVTAVYPGSFDPPTLGHVNIVERASACFDEVIIAVAESTSKGYVFNTDERVDLWKKVIPKKMKNVKVDTFKGLLVDYCDDKGANILIRGLRNIGDFEYEISMAQTNRTMKPHIEVLFMMTEGKYSHLSSSLIKEIVYLGGSVKGMVPALIEKELKKRISPKARGAE